MKIKKAALKMRSI